MPRYGLTGNMGCGKSTVAKFFKEFKDVVVFDADSIAKEILCDERHSPEILKLLGPQVFSDGKIDTRKVGRLVFNDYEALKKLEDFIHPLTWRAISEKERTYRDISFFIVESALIYESKTIEIFDGIIVATCDEAEQFYRLRRDRGLTDEEIIKRLKRQLPLAEKVKRADFVVDTACSLPEVGDKIRKLYEYLKGGIDNEKNRCLPRHF